jgi:hypothetical protein
MASENAIQAGSKLTAILNEVGAVTHRLAKALLTGDDLSQIRQRWPEIAQCFQTANAYETARGTLEKGDGIGMPLIRTYLGNGDEELSPRDEHQVRDGLAALKACGTICASVHHSFVFATARMRSTIAWRIGFCLIVR